MNKYIYYFLLISVILLIAIFVNLSFAQGQGQGQGQRFDIPMCVSPNNLLIIPGNWQSNKFLISNATPGSLKYVPNWEFKTTSTGNILNASNTWIILDKGLILSGPSNNFPPAGAMYFRDLNKSTRTSGSTKYNEFSFFMSSSSNDLIFHYNDVLRNASITVLTISTSGDIINKRGRIISREFCLRTDSGTSSCLTSWAHSPAVPHFIRFIMGPEYWDQDLINRLITSTERSVSRDDPYIRPGSSNYDRNIGNGYPYLKLHDIINRIGIDPDNRFSTKRFILGYGYRQVYTNRLTALFIEEGDNSSPMARYSVTSYPFEPSSSDDVFVYCHYRKTTTTGAIIYMTRDKNICNNIRDGGESYYNNYEITSYTFAQKNTSTKGWIFLYISLEPAQQRTVCTKRNYLNPLLISSWGNPRIINLRIGAYRYPNLEGDPCLDNINNINRMPNLNSLIMGRFIVVPYPTTTTTSRDYIEPTDITTFLNNTSTNFTYVIKSLGVVELLSY